MAKWVKPMAQAGGALGIGVALVLLVGAVASQDSAAGPSDTAAGVLVPRDLDTGALRGPEQPIFFRHDLHAGQYQMQCRYCHSFVDVSTSPGLPSTASCMGCHMVVRTDHPEVQKLQAASNEQRPIAWVEVHRLPQFVHFPHQRHVVAGQLACADCHGQVQEMPRVRQVASLKMGWCLDCHTQRGATTDCTACHY
jgi:hypothetical protein